MMISINKFDNASTNVRLFLKPFSQARDRLATRLSRTFNADKFVVQS